MYVPAHFDEPRIEVMHELMQARPLATLITLSPHGINANHIPLHLQREPGQFGSLRGHVARANPMWRDLVQNVEALAVFHGPDNYISPSWYPTKQEHGKVVPTWNYAVVHAYGPLRVIDDPAWLRALLEVLTAEQEASFTQPWAPSDAPPEFLEGMIRAIVGFEIVVTKLSGKWKLSQNQPPQNQAGVVGGLNATGRRDAAAVAALVESEAKNVR